MGRAFSEVLTAELTEAPDARAISTPRLHGLTQTFGVRPASAPGISTERDLALAAGATRIAYGNYAVRGGRLDAQVSIENLQTGRIAQVISASGPADGVLSVAAALAHQISRQPTGYGTRNEQALRYWISAVEPHDANAVTTSLEKAIAADPDFAPPYRLLAQWKAQHQDRAGAEDLLQAALSRNAGFPVAERARIELELATLRDDAAQKIRALNSLAQADPSDPATWRQLAEAQLTRRDFRASIQAFQRLLAIEPEAGADWNRLGYTAAYAGDFNGAINALRRYQALRPADADPIDSQGDVNLIFGHLPEAEKLYLDAAHKVATFPNTPEMFKAAMARLMEGDIPGADAISKQYTDARAKTRDPGAGFYAAEWSWITGRHKEAYGQLAAIARASENGPLRELAARAYAELALWSLFQEDRSTAEQMAQKAGTLTGPAVSPIVVVARFLALPPASADEWTARAQKLLPNPNQAQLRDLTLAYALLLAKEYQPASAVLDGLYKRTPAGSDDSLAVLLAWTLCETGRFQDAAPLLKPNPVPPITGPGPFLPLYFPRLYQLRAAVAGKQGQPAEAAENLRLFRALAH